MALNKRRSPLERYKNESGLAAIRGPRLLVAEQPFSGKLLLRVRGGGQSVGCTLQSKLGISLPLVPNTVCGDERTVFWLGCDKWMIVCEATSVEKLWRRIDEELKNTVSAVSQYSDSRVVIRISGSDAPALIAKNCGLDLSPCRFAPGRCAQSLYSRIPVLIHQLDRNDGPCFDIYVDTSLCVYFWECLMDASLEFLPAEAGSETSLERQ